MLTRLLLCACVATIASGQATDDVFTSGVKVMYRALSQCEGSDLVTCLKMRTLKSIDRILKQDEVTVVEGVTFQKITPEDSRRGDNGRGLEETQLNEVDEKSLPDDPAKREEVVDQLLLERLSTFIGTRSLKVNMPKLIEDTIFTGRGQGGGFGGGKGGGGGGGKKGGGGIILLMGMLAGGLGAMALKTIALIAGKALIVAKVALVISAVIGLSKLAHKEHTTTYEIVKHPKVSHSHSYSSSHDFGGHGGGGDYEVLGGGGGGHYGRSLSDFHSHFLAYNSQIPANEKDTSEIREVESNAEVKQ